MNKLTISIFIISFWVLFPLPMQFMGLGNYEQIEDSLNVTSNPTILNYLVVSFALVVTYFQLLFIGIPQAPLIINLFLFILKLISGLILYLLLKGD